MKLTTFLVFLAILQVSAETYAQKITLKQKQISIKQVFKEIKKQTGYDVFYLPEMLDANQTIAVNFKDTPVEQVIDEILEGRALTFTIDEKTIVIKKREVPSLAHQIEATLTPPGTITGRVTNTRNEPLGGASVLVKRTKTGAITDANGIFVIKSVLPTDTLTISYIGYKTFTIDVGDRTIINCLLDEATNGLDQVMIQGYGRTTLRSATGDIGKVTASEIERQPIMNPLLALQGKVAGLDVNQTSGYASAPVKVEIRGRSAINSNFTADPLYVIDGVPLTVLDIGGRSSYQTGSTGFIQTPTGGPANGQSPLFSLNPADIESIEVLKDADATAIYGSRGANGVILITTKKGKAGKTMFNVNVQQGLSEQTRFYQLMNTQQYVQMRTEALKNDGITPSLENGDYDLLQWNTSSYTNWQKVLYGGIGHSTDAQLDLSGGDLGTTFRIAGGYHHQTGISTVNGSDQRGSLSFNLTHRSLDQRFSISLTTGYTYTQSDMISLPGGTLLPPDAPSIYDSAGNLNFSGWGGTNSSARAAYPFGSLMQPYNSKTNFLNSNLVFNYQPVKNLRFSTSFGYNYSQANLQNFRLIASQDPIANPTGSNSFNYNNNKNLIIEPQINYDALVSKGKLSALVGASTQHTNTDGLYLAGRGYTDDNLITNINGAATKVNVDNYGEYKYAALFGRLTYNWEDKYILNLNARRDGSSRFGPGRQYGNFGSIGAAWNFTEESWLNDRKSFLSFGKLRGSYGTTGSDAVGDYQYLTRWSTNGTSGLPYSGVQPLAPQQHADPNFQWQVNKKLEVAIDLGFLKDRITFSANYYRDRVGNQLVAIPIAAVTGFTSVTANSPALVENHGWEFTTNARIIDIKDFSWSTSFNIAINRNKLLAYPNLAQSTYAGTLIVGKSLNIVNLLHFTGVDPQTGEYTFLDKNHDGQITNQPGQPNDDTFPLDLSPKFLGGLGMNFNYKTLQLILYFNFKKQIGINALNQTGGTAGVIGNQPAALIGKEWQKPGDNVSIAKFTTQPGINYAYFQQSDALYTDASFIRLSNVSLSYGLPKNLAEKIGASRCSIFIHTNNLFTITGYKGVDPETQNFGGLPPSRVITSGLNINF